MISRSIFQCIELTILFSKIYSKEGKAAAGAFVQDDII